MKLLVKNILKHFSPEFHRYILFQAMLKRMPRELVIGREKTILLTDKPAGLFAMMFQVIGAIELCRKLSCNLVISFNDGFYYDPNLNINWWSNYFIDTEYRYNYKYNQNDFVLKIEDIDYKDQLTFFARDIHPVVAHQLISLIKIKPHIANIINDYVDRLFKGEYVIGIHYRGTDKVEGHWIESIRVPYDYVVSYIDKLPQKTKIFIATDEAQFLEYMTNIYKNRVICYNSLRSYNGTPVHIPFTTNSNAYKAGEDAIVDSILLSKCDFLLRTDSNLSLASTYYNPKIQCINLTDEFKKKCL